MEIIKKYEDINCKKYGIKLDDGTLIETAMFVHHEIIHFCVPTQAGCNMGCKHCATTYASIPFIRNLTTNEIIEMVELMKGQLWDNTLPRILSFSGHGEPMMNWDSIKECAMKYYYEFSEIFVTSIGLYNVMCQILLEQDVQPCIYFSIHGPSDEERAKIIPASKHSGAASLQQIIDFGRAYTRQGGRVVWNYMLCSRNASEESLHQLQILCGYVDYPLEIRFTKYIDIHKDNGIAEVNDIIIQAFYKKIATQLQSNICIRFSKLEGERMGIACGQMRASMQDAY